MSASILKRSCEAALQKVSENVCVHSEKELPSSGAENIRKGLELRDSNDPGPVNRKLALLHVPAPLIARSALARRVQGDCSEMRGRHLDASTTPTLPAESPGPKSCTSAKQQHLETFRMLKLRPE